MSLIQDLTVRRTHYALSKENFPISNDEVVKTVQEIIALTPSAFNNQTNRAIVLFGANHDKLWKITHDNLKAIVPADQFEGTAAKIAGFAAGYATVLFYQDTAIIKDFEQKFAPYAANFAPWAEQSSGSAQISVWTALSTKNVGANLQHYNEVIANDVASAFSVPSNWKLSSQLVIGAKAGAAGEKTTLPASETVKVFN